MARRGVGMKGDDLPVSAGFLEDFRALTRSRARALFLYGEADEVYRSFEPVKDRLLHSLDPAARSRIDVEVWPGPMHGFVEIGRQREAFERVVGWIEALHPQAAPQPRPRGDKAWISS